MLKRPWYPLEGYVDSKKLAAVLLAYAWYRIVWAASDTVLLEVLPWLMGAVRPIPNPWW